MSLDDLVTINITQNTATPTQEGFGVPLIASYHTLYADFVRTYSTAAQVLSDGFQTTSQTYKAAQAIKAQNPCPPQFKVGRRTSRPAQTQKLQVTTTTPGAIYSFVLDNGVASAPVTISYTVPVSATTTTIAAAIGALITTAAKGATVAVATDTITLTQTVAGTLFLVSGWTPNFNFSDVTTDPGIVSDLNAIQAVDNTWYGLLLAYSFPAEILAAASWCESSVPKKLFCCNVSDTACGTTSTTDLLSTLKLSAYTHTVPLFSASGPFAHTDAAWMAQRFTAQPGSDTWAYKTLLGVPADLLTESQTTNISSKYGSYFTPLAGVNCTYGGRTPSGEWADVVRGIDWLQNTMQLNVFALQLNNAKIPFTNLGIDMIQSVVQATLKTAENVGLLEPGSSVVTSPDISTVSSIDRNNRNLSGVTWTAQLAGAIQLTTISGTVS